MTQMHGIPTVGQVEMLNCYIFSLLHDFGVY